MTAVRESDPTDRQLLEGYIHRREEAAMEALVHRHGPMVWGVCRRLLFDHHDAEDAFQATFLVLVRKAASIVSRELVANWLYGVAHQTALKARATTARRRAREKLMALVPEPVAPPATARNDLPICLDSELNSLPAKYRAPIVLCDLQGKTRQEAARELDWPEGTVAGRLARARAMLAKRLLRRGVVLPAVGLSAAVATAGVPVALTTSTVKAASLFAAGQAAVSAPVAALVKGVLDSMWLHQMKGVAAVVLSVVVLGVAVALAGLLLGAPNDDPPRQNELEGKVFANPMTKPDLNGFSVGGVAVVGKQVDFKLSYGSNVEGVQEFQVRDKEGNLLWSVAGSSQNNLHKFTYGVPPFDKTYLGGNQQRQLHPALGKAPEDIKGKEVRIKVNYRFQSLLGPGMEFYEATVRVPEK